MAIKDILTVGCSITYGEGLSGNLNDPKLWVNQICHTLWPDSKLTNMAKTAKNNYWIFMETMWAITQKKYDLIVVAWTNIPRYDYHVGLELYNVHTMLTGEKEVRINGDVVFSADWINDTGDRLRMLHHDHWDTLEIVKYVNILIKLQEEVNHGKILFVNALLPWANDFFNKKSFTQPSELSEYEQNFLSVNTRDDGEIHDLYNMVHEHYESYGGIHEDHWLNLYQSLTVMRVDTVSEEDRHPGYLSQELYTKYLIEKILTKGNLCTY